MTLQEGGTGAYAPTRAVVAVIERYRERGLPAPIDTDTLVRAGLTTESLAPRTVQSLKLLDLLDDAMQPTAELVALGKVPTDQFKERLAAVLRTAYADVLKFVDPAADDYERIRDQFRPYTPPSLRDRMAMLFLGLTEFAGIIPEGRTKELTGRRPATGETKSPRPPSTRSSRATSEPSSNGSEEPGTPGPIPQGSTTPGGDSRTLTLKSGDTVTVTLSAPLLLLPKGDRTFVLQIIEKMEDYEDKIEASAGVQT